MDASVQAPAIDRVSGVGVVASSLFAGAAAVPLVFSYDVAMWFNDRFVTADIPPAKDLQTWLEVGTWTWNWMEPPLGTISFVLLCVQSARGQGLINPVTTYLARRRVTHLLATYPRYSPMILLQWAATDLKADLAGSGT